MTIILIIIRIYIDYTKIVALHYNRINQKVKAREDSYHIGSGDPKKATADHRDRRGPVFKARHQKGAYRGDLSECGRQQDDLLLSISPTR